jgi:hypothetical protein
VRRRLQRRPARPRAPEPDRVAGRLPRTPGPLGADGLADAVLEGADLAGSRAVRGELLRCIFRGCRLTGLDWAEGDVHDVVFEDCRLDLAGLRHASLQRVRFTGCDLRELDLARARAEDVLIEHCDLRQADLSGLRAQRLELRGCRVDGLRGVEGLRGALMTWPDVLELAGPLAAGVGIVLLDEEGDPG